jgi:hypothetical protein
MKSVSLVLRGNTYPVKELLKQSGATWDSANKQWILIRDKMSSGPRNKLYDAIKQLKAVGVQVLDLRTNEPFNEEKLIEKKETES